MNPYFYKKEKGYSLLELMVALGLSAFLLTGVISIYSEAQVTERVRASLSAIQETGSFSLDLLAKDIRMASYQGCAEQSKINLVNVARNPPTSDFSATAVRGWEVTNANWAAGSEFDNIADIEPIALIGSDVLAIQYGEPVSGDDGLIVDMASDSSDIVITNNDSGIEVGDIAIVSDCASADMFRVSAVIDAGTTTISHGGAGNSSNNLNKTYTGTADLLIVRSVLYFVADTGRDMPSGDPIYALYRATDDMADDPARSFTVEEVLEGVDSMQITYGERLANGGMVYRTADNIGTPAGIESIRLGLLVSDTSLTRQTDDNITYQLPGQAIPPLPASQGGATHLPDRKQKRDFITTIAIRNRL